MESGTSVQKERLKTSTASAWWPLFTSHEGKTATSISVQENSRGSRATTHSLLKEASSIVVAVALVHKHRTTAKTARFPQLLPQEFSESAEEALDALEAEFAVLQVYNLPEHILKEERCVIHSDPPHPKVLKLLHSIRMRQWEHSSQLNYLTSWVKPKMTFLNDDEEDGSIEVPHGFEEFLEFDKKLPTSAALKKLLVNELFKRMFPDSEVAQSFTCGEQKCSYIACHGLRPFFLTSLRWEIENSDYYVVLFDESLNENCQQKQLDVHLRYWDASQSVTVRYFTSVFMGHARAEDLQEKLLGTLEPLPLHKIVQISMDGPNVNLKALRGLQEHLQKNYQ
ncbi:hypothetical protein V5799_013448, partial [Amblyomma americanum]